MLIFGAHYSLCCSYIFHFELFSLMLILPYQFLFS